MVDTIFLQAENRYLPGLNSTGIEGELRSGSDKRRLMTVTATKIAVLPLIPGDEVIVDSRGFLQEVTHLRKGAIAMFSCEAPLPGAPAEQAAQELLDNLTAVGFEVTSSAPSGVSSGLFNGTAVLGADKPKPKRKEIEALAPAGISLGLMTTPKQRLASIEDMVPAVAAQTTTPELEGK